MCDWVDFSEAPTSALLSGNEHGKLTLRSTQKVLWLPIVIQAVQTAFLPVDDPTTHARPIAWKCRYPC